VGTKTFNWTDLRRFATVDLAASIRTTADYSVVGSFAVTPDNKLLVLEIDRARREGPDLVPAMQRAVSKWDLSTIWVERVGFQLALIQEASRKGLPVRELTPDRDKVARALPATAALESGRVLLPRHASWTKDFEAEVLSFPIGQHDDQVDVLSYAVEVARTLPSATLMPCFGQDVDEREHPLADLLPAEAFDDRGRLRSIGEMLRDMGPSGRPW
jgi:predicted phage terminase large subunit-like protein